MDFTLFLCHFFVSLENKSIGEISRLKTMIIKTSSAFFFFFHSCNLKKLPSGGAVWIFFLTNFISQHCPNGIRKERDKVKSVFCSQKEVVLAVIYSILPDLLLKYPNLFLGYRTKTWKYMKNDKLNASCIPKAVISRDWQRLPTHPQLVQIMWFLCSIHLFYYYDEEWTSFKGCCIGIVWVEDNNRFSHISRAVQWVCYSKTKIATTSHQYYHKLFFK